jgi:hypothetical protein
MEFLFPASGLNNADNIPDLTSLFNELWDKVKNIVVKR